LRGDGRHGTHRRAGYFAVFKAIELASPARLAPFYYLQIITAVALGYWMFGDCPTRGPCSG
jgi:drug/metabolite transporter (DMT)-like permease